MSGGHFDYNQYNIGYIADEIEHLITTNGCKEKNEYGYMYDEYTPEVIEEFKKGLTVLRQAQIYAQRIDWLVCGDDGEDMFLKRLASDLSKLNQS